MSEKDAESVFGVSQLMEVGGNQGFFLDEPNVWWIVIKGQVELFALPDGNKQGRRHHLASFSSGKALFGISGEQSAGLILLATGVPGTQVARITQDEIRQLSGSRAKLERFRGLLEEWIQGLSDAIVSEKPPKVYEKAELGETISVDNNVSVSAEQGLRWLKHLKGHSYWLAGKTQTPFGRDGEFIPVTDKTWVLTGEKSEIAVFDTAGWFEQDKDWLSLAAYYQRLFAYLVMQIGAAKDTETLRLKARVGNDRRLMGNSLLELASVSTAGEKTFTSDSTDPLFEACRLVGAAANIEMCRPPVDASLNPSADPLNEIINASRIRSRRVALKGEWWHGDHGPLLAYLDEGNRPVAILPVKSRAYDFFDPQTRKRTRIDAKIAATVSPFAYSFYRTLPNKKLGIMDILRFTWKGNMAKDVFTVALMGIAGGLLGMAIPIATGSLFDSVIPEAERGQLVQIILLLIAAMFGAMLFGLTRSIAMLRLEGRLDSQLQSAIWDRLLNLPVTFFKGYSVGDLAMRANSINSIRKTISGTTMSTILSGLFSTFNLFLLFHYNNKLALIALGLVVVSVLVTVGSSLFQLRLQRILSKEQGKLSGLILQLIKGIAKFRVAGAESRAFYLWARQFSNLRRITFRARNTGNYFQTFNMTFPIITTIIIYASVGFMADQTISTGQFLAFYSAFSSFIAAMTAVFGALVGALSVIPLYELAKPILETVPEIDEGKKHPGELAGEIEVSRLSFRYSEDTPVILEDVSLRIKPGEFIAIIGSSGSGKSTLFRLLLGFEKPLAGAVYFDGQDLSQLDVRAVRQQFGVVLQNSKLMAGDVYSNIVGSKKLTINDAKEALRMAGMEQDIEQMPMGLHTVISEGGSTISGGQRQRLMIARAIVSKPRILFFDEATSALDNKTQAIVSHSLERLKATRVVVAHRLSTIINADRIYVLDKGKIVQVGKYDELIEQDGLFAELAKRQLA